MLMKQYAAMISIQTSPEKGRRKENNDVTLCVGFLNSMLIPVCINGRVKSTPFKRSELMVKSAIAKSASW